METFPSLMRLWEPLQKVDKVKKYCISWRETCWLSSFLHAQLFVSLINLLYAQDGTKSTSYLTITILMHDPLIKQSIGFIGPGISLLCLNYAKTPVSAAVIITAALSLSSFSQAGFLLNMQVSFIFSVMRNCKTWPFFR